MRIHMTVADKRTSLYLTKNTKIREDMPIYVVRNGVVVQEHIEPPEVQQAFYQNSQYGASFVIEINYDDTSYHHSLVGTFFIDNVMYVMQPVNQSEFNKTDGNPHVLASLKDTIKTSNYQYMDPVVETVNVDSKRSRRQATGNYKIELLIVTDYSIYQKWYARSTGTIHQIKDAFAKNAIRNFYQSILNGIDTRFGNLINHGIRISVVAVGFIISDTVESSTFTENNKKTASFGQVNTAAVLASFQSWIATTSGIPSHDHATVFSAYELLATGFEISWGLAYVDEMCSARSQSIVEDRFDTILITVASHELGHSLNSLHDGQDNTCSSAAGYIMSIINTAVLKEKAANPWRFSGCSVTYIRSKIAALDASSSNCLLKDSTPEIVISDNNVLPGKLYAADIQCQYIHGISTSYLCRTLYNFDFSSVCKGMWCKKVSSDKCQLSLPADGMSCGNRKWCIKGECVADDEAPPVSDACPYGDRPGLIYNGKSCRQIVTTERFLCYENDMQMACCSTCLPDNIDGCEFGDRATACSSLVPVQCYDVGNRNTCCETCLNFYSGDPNCPYGDKNPNCQEANCYVYTPSVREACCKTCSPTAVITTTHISVPTTPQIAVTTTPWTTVTTTPSTTVTTTQSTTVTTTPWTVTPTEKSRLSDIEIGAIAGGCGLFLIGVLATFFLCNNHSRTSGRNQKPNRTGAIRKHRSRTKKPSKFSDMKRTRSLENKPKKILNESRRRRSSADKYKRMQNNVITAPTGLSNKRFHSPGGKQKKTKSKGRIYDNYPTRY